MRSPTAAQHKGYARCGEVLFQVRGTQSAKLCVTLIRHVSTGNISYSIEFLLVHFSAEFTARVMPKSHLAHDAHGIRPEVWEEVDLDSEVWLLI